jgi:hypothetical protein
VQTLLPCYRVLLTNGDDRAAGLLLRAYSLLQERAGRISDSEVRRSFLEDVPAHQRVVQLHGEAGPVGGAEMLGAVTESGDISAGEVAAGPAEEQPRKKRKKAKKGKRRRPRVIIVLGDVYGDIEADVVIVIGDR